MNVCQEDGEAFSLEHDDAYRREGLHEDAPRLFKDSGSSNIEILYTVKQSTGIDNVEAAFPRYVAH